MALSTRRIITAAPVSRIPAPDVASRDGHGLIDSRHEVSASRSAAILALPNEPQQKPSVIATPARPSKPLQKESSRHRPQTQLATRARRAPRPYKAVAIRLNPSASIDDAMATILGACRDHWKKNVPAARMGGQIEGLHQMRVGLRRFRTALALFRDYIPASQYAYLNGEAKAVNAALAPARDLDVFIDDLGQISTGKRGEDPDVIAVSRAAGCMRSRARRAADATLSGARYHRFMARLDAWLIERRWRTGKRKKGCGSEPASDVARRVLGKRLAKIWKRTKGIKRARPEALHDLRIAIKKGRYALEFFKALLPSKQIGFIGRQLKALQDSLGRLNDLEVAQRTMTTLIESAANDKQRHVLKSGRRKLAAHFRSLAEISFPKTIRAGVRLRSQKPL